MANVVFMKSGMEIASIRDVQAERTMGNVPLKTIDMAIEKVSRAQGLDIQGAAFKAGRDWDEVRVDSQRITAASYNKAVLDAARLETTSPSGVTARPADNTPKMLSAPKNVPDWDLQ